VNGEKWLHQHTTTQKLLKLQELMLWISKHFVQQKVPEYGFGSSHGIGKRNIEVKTGKTYYF